MDDLIGEAEEVVARALRKFAQGEIVPLSPPSEGWDINSLLQEIDRNWELIRPAFMALPRNQTVSPGELRSAIILLRHLRNRARHRGRVGSKFTRKDRDRFLNLAEFILVSAGLEAEAKEIAKLQPLPGQNYPILETLKTKYVSLSPEIKRVWMLARKAYGHWQHSDQVAATEPLDDVVKKAALPRELLQRRVDNLYEWLIPNNKLFDSVLWSFCKQLYPAEPKSQHAVCQILSPTDHENFDIARRNLGTSLQQIGETFERHGFDLNDMGELRNDASTLKLSAFFETALIFQLQTEVPGPTGIFHLCELAMPSQS
jgi:hypothetical protein